MLTAQEKSVGMNTMDDIIIEKMAAEEAVVPKKAKTVSFSQYAKWLKCPMSWKLSYIDHLVKYEPTIHTAFGKAIHVVIQTYLKTLYTSGAIEADKMDCLGLFNTEYDREIATVANVSDEDKEEFRRDGKIIIEYFVSYSIRSKHFPSKIFEVVGVELPLIIPIRGGTINYKGFLDIVLKEKSSGKIRILDFKTSTMGWNKYQKADRTKIDQLLLYKRFYNQIYKTPINDIEVEFIILKRKLLEDVAFPQQRIQRVSPPDGKMSMRTVEGSFLDFINECFKPDGGYNTDGYFLKNPGKAKKNCKYCDFKDMRDKDGKLYCDGKEG